MNTRPDFVTDKDEHRLEVAIDQWKAEDSVEIKRGWTKTGALVVLLNVKTSKEGGERYEVLRAFTLGDRASVSVDLSADIQGALRMLFDKAYVLWGERR